MVLQAIREASPFENYVAGVEKQQLTALAKANDSFGMSVPSSNAITYTPSQKMRPLFADSGPFPAIDAQYVMDDDVLNKNVKTLASHGPSKLPDVMPTNVDDAHLYTYLGYLSDYIETEMIRETELQRSSGAMSNLVDAYISIQNRRVRTLITMQRGLASTQVRELFGKIDVLVELAEQGGNSLKGKHKSSPHFINLLSSLYTATGDPVTRTDISSKLGDMVAPSSDQANLQTQEQALRAFFAIGKRDIAINRLNNYFNAARGGAMNEAVTHLLTTLFNMAGNDKDPAQRDAFAVLTNFTGESYRHIMPTARAIVEDLWAGGETPLKNHSEFLPVVLEIYRLSGPMEEITDPRHPIAQLCRGTEKMGMHSTDAANLSLANNVMREWNTFTSRRTVLTTYARIFDIAAASGKTSFKAVAEHFRTEPLVRIRSALGTANTTVGRPAGRQDGRTREGKDGAEKDTVPRFDLRGPAVK